MGKSYVTLETAVCPVCGKEHETGTLLLDKRLRDRFERNTCTGFKICAEHQKVVDDGYVIMVACDESKSKRQPNGNLKPEDAYRTGELIYIKRDVASKLFRSTIEHPFVFCEPAVVEMLRKMAENSQE